jgi:hypothetical protein
MQRCHFCKSPATMTCSFKQSEPRIVMPEEIRERDIVRDDLTLAFRCVLAIVGVIENFTTKDPALVILNFAGDREGSSVLRTLTASLPCLRMETHPCGLPVCENHIREFADGITQCAEHWPSVDRVYSVD